MPYVNVQLRRHLPSLRGGYHIDRTGSAVYARPSGTECASRAPAQTPAHALNCTRTPSQIQETRCQKIPNRRINGSNFSRYSENQKSMGKSKSRHSTASRPAAGTATRPSTPRGNFLPRRPRNVGVSQVRMAGGQKPRGRRDRISPRGASGQGDPTFGGPGRRSPAQFA